MAAPARPFDQVRTASIGDFPPIVMTNLSGANPPAVFADYLVRMPRLGSIRVADFLVNAADHIRLAQNGVDGFVETPGTINVPHPIKLRTDSQFFKHSEE